MRHVRSCGGLVESQQPSFNFTKRTTLKLERQGAYHRMTVIELCNVRQTLPETLVKTASPLCHPLRNYTDSYEIESRTEIARKQSFHIYASRIKVETISHDRDGKTKSRMQSLQFISSHTKSLLPKRFKLRACVAKPWAMHEELPTTALNYIVRENYDLKYTDKESTNPQPSRNVLFMINKESFILY